MRLEWRQQASLDLEKGVVSGVAKSKEEEAKLSLVHLPTILRDIYFKDLPVRRRLRRDHQRCQKASRHHSSE
jgi:hypothetical protein